jgi:VIT1/CCC1 family predicted Fe2+/Mn2+ transporter
MIAMSASDEKRYRENLRAEAESSALYRALAQSEPDPRLAKVYARLADVEDAHAELWRDHLRRLGLEPPGLSPGWRTRALAWLARRFGAGVVLPIVNRMEHAGSANYDTQAEAVDAGLPPVERSHARVLRTIALTSGVRSGISGTTLARLEGRHRAASGNALRAAVLGANDGLVSNLSLVMGVAGAEFSGQTILITGLAGLVAGACSMAMGEWLSVTSSRELYLQQIATEAAELEAAPEEEEEELALIYQAKGLGEDEARALAKRLIADKGTALDTLAREELGIDPKDLGGSATVAAATSFALFAVGALVPVLPFVFAAGWTAVWTSIGVSAAAMFAMGAGITFLTGRRPLISGLRQLAIGVAAAGVTFGLGRLIGVALA